MEQLFEKDGDIASVTGCMVLGRYRYRAQIGGRTRLFATFLGAIGYMNRNGYYAKFDAKRQ